MSKLKNNVNKKNQAKNKPNLLVEKFPVDLGIFEPLARQLQREAAKVWNMVCTLHRTLYIRCHAWLNETGMDDFVKGKFNLLHSQSVQAIVSTYYEAWERTRELKEKGYTDWRYPYRKKYFFTVTWKKSAVTHKGTYLKLSNKRGVKSLEFENLFRSYGTEIVVINNYTNEKSSTEELYGRDLHLAPQLFYEILFQPEEDKKMSGGSI